MCGAELSPSATTRHWRSRRTPIAGAPAAHRAHRACAARSSASAGPAKKKALRAAEQERPDVQAARVAFQARVGALNPHRLGFLDESGVLTNVARLYARAPNGQRACGSAPAGRWQRLTVLGALVSNGVVAAMSIAAATDTAVFLAFLDHGPIPALRTSKPDAVVVMDDPSAHKARAVRERLEAAGLELLYLPRCSPELSPIEPMWSKLKMRLRAPRPVPWMPSMSPWPMPSTRSRPTTPAAGSSTAATLSPPIDPQSALSQGRSAERVPGGAAPDVSHAP